MHLTPTHAQTCKFMQTQQASTCLHTPFGSYVNLVLFFSSVHAEAVLKGTNVDGVYDCTSRDNNFTFEHISFRDLASRGVTPMDAMALNYCEENNTPGLCSLFWFGVHLYFDRHFEFIWSLISVHHFFHRKLVLSVLTIFYFLFWISNKPILLKM
jgi:hypothetical protein